MTEPENHFTVFIRLPFNRGSFVDPPPVAWSASKERELWDIISRSSKGNEIDWKKLSEDFQVTQPFLLQQAAWLYERQLSQVRAQMRRMGGRHSVSASPVPASTAGSVVTAQTTKRTSVSSRTPSRLSTQMVNTVNATDASTPLTPARSRNALPFRSGSGATSSHLRGGVPTSTSLSRKSSKDNESISRTHSRRGSVQHQLTRSPVDLEPPEQSSSDEEPATSKTVHKRPNSASLQRRPGSLRKSQHTRASSITHQQVDEETEEEDSPAFLPPTNISEEPRKQISTRPDPSATITGDLHQAPQSVRPVLTRNVTSERIRPSAPSPPPASKPMSGITATQSRPPPTNTTSSTSSLSSSNNTNAVSTSRPQPSQQSRISQTQNQPAPSTINTIAHRSSPSVLPNPLSPRQQAALATAAGLSPRRRSTNTNPHSHSHSHSHTGGPGSESSPSMGSSFSDLDDASVTQSALEEALMSNMGSTTTAMTSTAIGTAATGAGTMGAAVGNALGSRVSGFSQALRSRYFDVRSGNGNGGGEGQQR